MINPDIDFSPQISRLITMQDDALELLFSMFTFAGFEKAGVKVVSFHFA